MNRSSLILTAALALSTASAAPPPKAPKAKDVPAVTERVVSGLYLVEGEFNVHASPATAWGVLTDYDRIGGFVSSIRKSAVKERRAEDLLVEQEALGKALFVTRQVHVLLEVHETPRLEILFRDISRTDFEVYAGSWTLTPNSEGVRITYRLRARPHAPVPRFLSDQAFRQGASELLSQVRVEIERRTHTLSDARIAPPTSHP